MQIYSRETLILDKKVAKEIKIHYICEKQLYMSQEELDFINWLPKITERLMLFNLHIKEHIDKISEEDWEMIRAIHRVWCLGELPPYYKSIPDMECQTVTQVDLFTEITTDTAKGFFNGTEVEYAQAKTKTEDNEDI